MDKRRCPQNNLIETILWRRAFSVKWQAGYQKQSHEINELAMAYLGGG